VIIDGTVLPILHLNGYKMVLGGFLRNVVERNADAGNFRLFGPDETVSNLLEALFEVTDRQSDAPCIDGDEFLAPGRRGAHLKQLVHDELVEHNRYIDEHVQRKRRQRRSPDHPDPSHRRDVAGTAGHRPLDPGPSRTVACTVSGTELLHLIALSTVAAMSWSVWPVVPVTSTTMSSAMAWTPFTRLAARTAASRLL